MDVEFVKYCIKFYNKQKGGYLALIVCKFAPAQHSFTLALLVVPVTNSMSDHKRFPHEQQQQQALSWHLSQPDSPHLSRKDRSELVSC